MTRIRPATVTLGLVAIFFGLVATYAARRYFEPTAPQDDRVPVVVARVNLPTYARIRDQDIEVVKMAPSQVPEGAVTMPSRVWHRVAKQTFMSGQPILEEGLYGVGQKPTLAEQLPPGYRAVTFAIDKNNALGGVLMPESVVDIALTVKGDHPELQGVATMTILRGIRVLATSQHLLKTEEFPNQQLRSVTVSATPEQANKLILAQRYGSLSVTLRSPLEDQQIAVNDNDKDLVNPLTLLGLPPVPPPAAVTRAQIWRGANMVEVTFEGNQIKEERAVNIATTPLPASPVAEAQPVVPTAYTEPNFNDTNPVKVPSAAPNSVRGISVQRQRPAGG